MLPDFLTDPSWLGVIVTVALPVAGWAGRWAWEQWRRSKQPLVPQTQSKKDHRNYDLLLHKYESYLDLLSDLIVIRAQVEAGPDEYTPELEREFIRTRDGVYRRLEVRGEREKDMGVFQLLDVLEGRMVGAKEQRKKRTELEARQAEIEDHPLFVKR